MTRETKITVDPKTGKASNSDVLPRPAKGPKDWEYWPIHHLCLPFYIGQTLKEAGVRTFDDMCTRNFASLPGIGEKRLQKIHSVWAEFWAAYE
jgi:hypothetical protein